MALTCMAAARPAQVAAAKSREEELTWQVQTLAEGRSAAAAGGAAGAGAGAALGLLGNAIRSCASARRKPDGTIALKQ